MAKILDMSIPVPPLEIQQEIVSVLNSFTELEAELEARKKQYEHYRDQLLSFEKLSAEGGKLSGYHFVSWLSFAMARDTRKILCRMDNM